jgi:hypothetical protein
MAGNGSQRLPAQESAQMLALTTRKKMYSFPLFQCPPQCKKKKKKGAVPGNTADWDWGISFCYSQGKKKHD